MTVVVVVFDDTSCCPTSFRSVFDVVFLDVTAYLGQACSSVGLGWMQSVLASFCCTDSVRLESCVWSDRLFLSLFVSCAFLIGSLLPCLTCGVPFGLRNLAFSWLAEDSCDQEGG